MQYTAFIALDPTGAPLNTPKVWVYQSGTSTLVQVYDPSGSPMSQPFNGSTTGLIEFEVNDGVYDIQIESSDGTLTLPLIKRQQIIDLTSVGDAFDPTKLAYYARVAGITLGTGNDQPAFDAAHTAMAALASGQMLYVEVAAMATPYMVDQVKIYSRAGFWCAPGAAMLRQKSTSAVQPIVTFGNLDWDSGTRSTAASWLLWGFKIDGGYFLNWTASGGVDETDPRLAHYGTTEASNGGDPDRYMAVGQAGVYLRGAFADASYTTPGISENQPVPYGDGDARYRIGELDITNVGGDGFHLEGTGAGVIGPIRVEGAGGRGIVLNAYDNHYGTLDAGGTGFEGLVIRQQCSDSRIFAAKAWFTGLRANAGNTSVGGQVQDAGHQVGCWIDQPTNLVGVIEVQDSVGSAFQIDAPVNPRLDLTANWIGLPPSQQAADCGGIDLSPTRYSPTSSTGGYIRAHVMPWNASPYPHVVYAIRTSGNVSGTVIELSQQGLQNNDTTDNFKISWIQGSATVFGSYTPTLPSNGQTLVINGYTVTFESVATINDVATQINAAAIPHVTAKISLFENLLVITAAPPNPDAVPGSDLSLYFGTLVIVGTAAAGLGVTTSSVLNSQSYYDRARLSFHNFWWGPQQWRANSGGTIPFGLNNFGALTGVVATEGGSATLLSESRSGLAQIGMYDDVLSTFKFALQGSLDGSGNPRISFFGGPAGGVQTLGAPGPLASTATTAQIVTAVNALMTALINIGLAIYST